MTDYELPTQGPGFPHIRFEELGDGRFVAEWLVDIDEVELLPLLARTRDDTVQVRISFPDKRRMLVRLVSEASPLRPEVYSVFYQLIRPAFDAGIVRSIEGGSLEVHRYIIEGTSEPPEMTR